MDDISVYVDTPLSLDHSRREIRLVAINPGTKGISCRLLKACLDQAPEYEALSYVWGAPDKTKRILLNDQPFEVTTNLEHALHNLRQEGSRTFWIDAICINQRNLEERSSQVLLMRTVYEHAFRTVVWLGAGSPKSRLAFALMRTITLDDLSQPEVPIAGPGCPGGPGGSRAPELVNKFKRSSHKSLVALIDDVLERAWFTRVWVVQEVAVSKNIVVLCGSDTMAWPDFSRFLYTVLSLSPELSLQNVERDGKWAFLTQNRICNMVREGDSIPFCGLVATGRFFQATDPRDMVFAFHGLAGDVDEDDSLIRPDYSDSNTVLAVYQNLISHTIRVQGSLDFIVMRRKYDRPDGSWPSWVPDWALPSPKNADQFSDILAGSSINNTPQVDSYGREMGPCECPFMANNGIRATAAVEGHPPTLCAQGVCVDVIQDLGEAFLEHKNNFKYCDFTEWDDTLSRNFGDPRGPQGEPISHVSEECYEIWKEATKEFSTVLKLSSFIYKTLFRSFSKRNTEDGAPSGRPADPGRDDTYIGGGTIIEAYTRTIFLDNVLGHGRGSSLGYESFSTGSWRETGFPFVDLPGSVLNRRLIVSQKGYIGMGPLTMEEGDMICVLFGCFVPVIFRKKEDYHILVGECYIHGLMYGQAIDTLMRGELESVEFRLR